MLRRKAGPHSASAHAATRQVLALSQFAYSVIIAATLRMIFYAALVLCSDLELGGMATLAVAMKNWERMKRLSRATCSRKREHATPFKW